MEVLVDHTDLVQRCLKRERIAQYELYQRYARAMFNVALRLMGNREEAENHLALAREDESEWAASVRRLETLVIASLNSGPKDED